MITPKAMVAAGATGLALLMGYQSYENWSSNNAMESRLSEMEGRIQSIEDTDEVRISGLVAELNAVQDRVGITALDTVNAQKAATTARKEQARAEAALRQTLDEQARTVESLRDQSEAKLQAVREETTTQIGAVNGQVSSVKTDLDTTRTDLAVNKREIGDMRDSLGRQIARNAEELASLRQRGEREYTEFDIRKSKNMERIADIRLQLSKTDVKAQKYDVTLQLDDNKLQKKGQHLNEPIQFNVGKQRIRYELVVNMIDKDRIRGYISTPKDSVGSSAALQD